MNKIQVSDIEQYVIEMSKKLRVEHNLTVQEFGEIIGSGPSFVYSAEHSNYKSKYNLKHINLIAAYFNISPKEFLPAEPCIKLKI